MNNEKKLPENFVIKRDETNPLWTKYISWFNKQSNYQCTGESSEAPFYGYLNMTGWDNYYGYQIEKIYVLTLEEWDSIVNPKEEKEYPVQDTISKCVSEALEESKPIKQPRLKVGDKIPEYLNGKLRYKTYIINENFNEGYRFDGGKSHETINSIQEGYYMTQTCYYVLISEVDTLIEEHERVEHANKKAFKGFPISGSENNEQWELNNGDEVDVSEDGVKWYKNYNYIGVQKNGRHIVEFNDEIIAYEYVRKSLKLITRTYSEIAQLLGCDVQQLQIVKD